MSVNGHVAVDPAFALPAIYEPVQERLRVMDPQFRLRKSADHPGYFVLERRVTRSKPTHTMHRDMRDAHIQAQDGYIHVTTVHPRYMTNPDEMIAELRQYGGDLHAPGNSADQFWWNLVRADRTAREVRRERRRAMFRDYYREMYDVVVNRMGNDVGAERYRINSAGPHEKLNIRQDSSAGEIPVTEGRDDSANQTRTKGRPEVSQLHDQSVQ